MTNNLKQLEGYLSSSLNLYEKNTEIIAIIAAERKTHWTEQSDNNLEIIFVYHIL